jgi:hypothetical protein
MALDSAPVFQPATAGDVTDLLVMMEALYTNDGHSFDAAMAEQATRSLLDSPTWGHIWLIQQDGRSIGYVVLTSFSIIAGGKGFAPCIWRCC